METVIAAIVNGLFAVIALSYGYRLNKKVNLVKDQVVNKHDTNMREEGDERHQENKEKLDTILREITRLRNSVTNLWNRSDKHNDQIHDLEITQTRMENK